MMIGDIGGNANPFAATVARTTGGRDDAGHDDERGPDDRGAGRWSGGDSAIVRCESTDQRYRLCRARHSRWRTTIPLIKQKNRSLPGDPYHLSVLKTDGFFRQKGVLTA
jgi:hypothetical protein